LLGSIREDWSKYCRVVWDIASQYSENNSGIHDKCVKSSVFVDESVNYESVSERNSLTQQHQKEEALKNPSMIKEVE